MKTKCESNSFEGMRVIADYNVGDQRIIVLDRSDNRQTARPGKKVSAPANTVRPIAARSTTASIVGTTGPPETSPISSKAGLRFVACNSTMKGPRFVASHIARTCGKVEWSDRVIY